MPEGPEIRRVADQLAQAVVGREAEAVRFGLPGLRRHEAELSGLRIEAVEPRGKALLTRFEGGRYLYSHNQLYGKWYVCRPGRPPRTQRSLRVAIETSEAWALLYSASEIEVLGEEQLATQPFLARIGPDVLAPGTTPRLLRARLRHARFAGRALGGLLLDQGFVAGLGNYLRSEILFFSGLTPGARPRELDDEQLGRLARAARSVTLRSYRTGGVTEELVRSRQAKNAGEPRRSWRHAVFGRAGDACRRCGTPIQRVVVGGRRLYRCARCQPDP